MSQYREFIGVRETYTINVYGFLVVGATIVALEHRSGRVHDCGIQFECVGLYMCVSQSESTCRRAFRHDVLKSSKEYS